MTTPLRLSSRLARVKPSITLAVTARAAELRSKGIDVLSFSAGEPDFDTPAHIRDAARAALDKGGVGKYTHWAGTPALRKVVAAELSRVHKMDVSPDNVLVSTGAKHSLYNLFTALLEEGDEVVIPAPYWVSYPAMVLLAGGNPVILPTRADKGFAPEASALEPLLTDKTRALILNTPSNPTGAVIGAEALREVAELCVSRGILLVSDDIYRQLVYGGATYTSVASLSPEIAAMTAVVDGLSKAYAMTGWRIGYCAGPPELLKGMSKLQSQSTSNPTHIAQVAAMAALTGPQECVAEMRATFDQRRRTMVERLRAIPGVVLDEPMGAFYCFPDLSAFVGRRRPGGGAPIADDVDLCNYLVEEGRSALVPGSGFGAPGFARLSYACSMETIQTGLDRIGEALGRLEV